MKKLLLAGRDSGKYTGAQRNVSEPGTRQVFLSLTPECGR